MPVLRQRRSTAIDGSDHECRTVEDRSGGNATGSIDDIQQANNYLQSRNFRGGGMSIPRLLTEPLQPLRIKIVLFISSYSPLFLILAIRFEEPPLRIAMGVVALTGVVLLGTLLLVAVNAEPREHIVVKVEDRGGEVAAYIATYLLPLVVLTVPTAYNLVGYGLFLIVSATVFVQSRMVYINPLVYLTGRRILAVTTEAEEVVFVINRRSIRLNEHIWAYDVILPLAVRAKPMVRTGE